MVAFTLLGFLSLSVLSLFLAAAWMRHSGERRGRVALALDQEIQRALHTPSRFLVPAARGAWVLEGRLPPEFAGIAVEWIWSDEPGGRVGMALIRVRARWTERSLDPERGVAPGQVERVAEAGVMVRKP